MAEYIEKATLLNRVIIPSICSCVQGPNAERLKKFCIDTVNNVSAADVTPVVHSKWEICCDGYYPYCKRCRNEPQGRVMTQFCPNCGAKMDEEVNYDD